MRVIVACLFAFLAIAARAAEVEFVRVWPQWHSAESFDRISEYLGNGENQGRQIVRRTHDEPRAGYYFLVRLKDAAGLSGARFVVDVIRPDGPEPKSFSFPAAAHAGATVFALGLTGVDWPGGEQAHPVAWRLLLTDANGRLLAEQKSFLWEKPAK
jgi:hypothetical protein